MLQKHSIALPGHVSLVNVVDAARRAARAFLLLQSRAALDGWLCGPYFEATRFGPRRIMTAGDGAPPEDIETQIARAQHQTKLAVRDVMATEPRDFLRRLPPIVHIVRAHDAGGACGFIPLDARGARLSDRVVALVLADYLTRPEDFVARASLGVGVTVSGEHAVSEGTPTLPKLPAVRGV
jgi:hypothetical protein